MSANVETMFSLRQTPWHGIGTIVQDAPTSAEAIRLAGLDWKVNQVEIFANVGKTKLNAITIPGMVANVRDTDNSVLGITSSKYKPVQNSEAFDFTDALIGKGCRYETAGSLQGGKRVWLLAKLPEDYTIAGDKVDPYLVFSNSHDGKGAIKVAITPVRVCCMNTLSLALRTAERSWSTKHMGDMNLKMHFAAESLGMAHHYMAEMASTAARLANEKFSLADFKILVNHILPLDSDASDRTKKNVQESRMELETRFLSAPDLQPIRETAWAAVQAVSDFAYHTLPKRMTDTYQESMMLKTLDGNALLDRAMDRIMEKVA